MEASRDRMYAERKKRNSSALLYWTGGVSLPEVFHEKGRDIRLYKRIACGRPSPGLASKYDRTIEEIRGKADAGGSSGNVVISTSVACSAV